MQLQTKQILAFRDRTSFMKQNRLVPILDYILLKDGHLIKTNLAAWAKMPVDGADGVTMLIDENTLYNYASRISAEVITFTTKGKNIYLSADMTSYFQTADAKDYPVMPVEDDAGEQVEVTSTTPYRHALAYVAKGESIPTFKGFVHSVNNLIWAGDGNAFYSYKQAGPELTLSVDAVQAIIQFEKATWYKAGNYDFFICDKFIYGFIKPELKGPDITRHLVDQNPSQSTYINRQRIINYCEMCVASTPKAVAIVKMSTALGQITFDMADEDYGKGNGLALPCDVELPEFNFNAALMIPILKALPYENLLIYRDHVQLTIRSEDENFQAMLQGLGL